MNTKNKFLVVVDMQRDFTTGVLGNDYAKAIIPNVVKLVDEFAEEQYPILFTMDSHTEESYSKCREGKHLPIPHCLIGKDGHKLIPELEGYLSDTLNTDTIYKLDCFGIPNLKDIIRDIGQLSFYLDPDTEYEIHFCGVVTNMCVLSVALSFQNLFKKSEIIIHSNACASNDPKLHEEALDVMRRLQMQII